MDATPEPMDPPGIFARATDDHPLDRLTYLLPGVSFVGWQPFRTDDPVRVAKSGFGGELSLVHWVAPSVYLGGAFRVERIDRTRAALGFEIGWQFVGLELAIARDFAAKNGPSAQWSAELAPYLSFGVIYMSPRFTIAIDKKPDSPGNGAAIVIGLKLPIRI
jgi:hypothetical protein